MFRAVNDLITYLITFLILYAEKHHVTTLSLHWSHARIVEYLFFFFFFLALLFFFESQNDLRFVENCVLPRAKKILHYSAKQRCKTGNGTKRIYREGYVS